MHQPVDGQLGLHLGIIDQRELAGLVGRRARHDLLVEHAPLEDIGERTPEAQLDLGPAPANDRHRVHQRALLVGIAAAHRERREVLAHLVERLVHDLREARYDELAAILEQLEPLSRVIGDATRLFGFRAGGFGGSLVWANGKN